MNTKLSLKALLLFAFAATNAFAQIPNNQFENWTPTGSYDNLDGWGNPNGTCTGSFYPCTKSTDIPIALGTYSLRLENDPSLLPVYCALGAASTGAYPNIKFPITGHPLSLTGYYKFLPLAGDTMTIIATLYNGASAVQVTGVQTSVAAPNWTSFNVPFPSYATADSASISLSAYNCCPFYQPPHGKSVLYVDNLNFDVLLTTEIAELSATDNISIYPNPLSSQTTIHTDHPLKNATLTVENCFGQAVSEIKNISGQTIAFHRNDLASGLYFVRLTEGGKTIAADKLVIADW